MFVQKIIVACYLFPFLIMGQNIDSLKRCLKTEAIDSVRLRLQYDIGHYTPIMRITYWDSLLIDAEKINSKYYEASSLLKKGAIYMRLGNYPLVLNNEFKALKIAEQINAKPLLCQIYNVLGVAYKENDETAKAFYYINQSLKINRKLGNDNGKSKAYIVLGMIYQEQRNYDEACFYQTKALQIAEKINDNELISTCYNNLGSAYLDKKEYAKAQHYFTKAFDVNEIVGNPYLRAFLLYNIGDAYCQCNDYKNGISFLENALEAMRKNKNLSGIKLCNERLSDVYLKQEPNNKALAYYKAFVANRDSLYNEENTKKLIQAEVNYEYEKKEYLIKQEAKQQRQIILWIAFIVVLIIILCIIFYAYKQKNNKLQQERNMAVLEQKLLRTQMNPHFVFNALTALRGLIYKDDKIEAGRYLSKVATLIRTTLDNSRTEFVLLNKEIETLEDYLKINQVLVTIPFEYKITIDTQIETDALLVPPMIIQPFIENALKYGLPEDKPASIEISINKHDSQSLFVSIKDNGKGIVNSNTSSAHSTGTSSISVYHSATTSVFNYKHQSLATTITKERLAHILKVSVNEIDINLIELKNENGTISGVETNFIIPVKHI